MILTLKVRKQLGQQAIEFVKKNSWFNTEYSLGKTAQFIIIPLNESVNKAALSKKFKCAFENKTMPHLKKSGNTLKEKLEKIVPKDQQENLFRSFEVVGDIAILDIPKPLEKLEKSIAWTLLRTNKAIKTVSKRATTTEGDYRIRKIKTLVGKDTSETIHTESGVRLKLDINKVYFSPRWATERLRIAKQVKPGENILVMFAGVGPFSLVINKYQPKIKHITSIELNPDACKYLNENIRLNCNIYSGKKDPAIATMLEKHTLICGDVKKVKLNEKFDRIVMPLPHLAKDFLPEALKVAKKGAIIHLYTFAGEKDLNQEKDTVIKKYPLKLLKTITCGAYAPGVDRYCLDLKVK